MRSTGQLGDPYEYLRPGSETEWVARWGIEPPSVAGYGPFLRAMCGAASTPNGVASIKVFALHAIHHQETIFGAGRAPFGDAAVKLVHLRRDDKVRAAVSEWKAAETGQWVLQPGDQRVAVLRRPRVAEITRYHHFQHAWERYWLAARAEDVDWIELRYEDVVADVPGAVDQIATFAGVGPVRVEPSHLPRRLAEGPEDAWIDEWAAETGGCAECGHT
jgi:LPS sulfotransferase NodH